MLLKELEVLQIYLWYGEGGLPYVMENYAALRRNKKNACFADPQKLFPVSPIMMYALVFTKRMKFSKHRRQQTQHRTQQLAAALPRAFFFISL